MFRKVFMFAVLSCFFGGALAQDVQQVITSEVFDDTVQKEYVIKQTEPVKETKVVPAWPLSGSEADFDIGCKDDSCAKESNKIVTKVRSDVVVENEFPGDIVIGNNFSINGAEWSGGPNISSGVMVPAGFDYECSDNVEMPLMRREMMEDDGGSVLSMSRSSRKRCGESADSYSVFAERAGFKAKKSKKNVNNGNRVADSVVSGDNDSGDNDIVEEDDDSEELVYDDFYIEDGEDDETEVMITIEEDDGNGYDAPKKSVAKKSEGKVSGQEIAVNDSYEDDDEEEGSVAIQDQVRSWVVAEGNTLREVLQSWCNKAGWDLVWSTSREYPIEASAVFKGRFVDVASALVRNFERATPIPYAKFYKGNRVVVVSTAEE